MALLQYFKLKKQKEHLSDPNGSLSRKILSSGISSANACVGKLPAFDSEGTSSTTSQSRGPYTVLTPAQKSILARQLLKQERRLQFDIMPSVTLISV